MTRTQMACYSLMASAFILGALVLVQASQRMNNQAHAEMVVNKDQVSLLTTRYRTNDEILYVLEGRTGLLLAYLFDANRNEMQLLQGGTLDINRAFDVMLREGRDDRPRRDRRGR